MLLTVAQVVQATGAKLSQIEPDAPVSSWSIDSRSVTPGDLFIAIKGEIHDAHQFVPSALASGALAALVQEPVAGPHLLVPDTLLALQQVATYAREIWGRDVVCITGSAGKTSTKDIVADLLGTGFRVGKTVGNLNNHIGLPLSILRMPDAAQIAVFELGMNHAGEIGKLTSIAKPRVGVVTNVGYAHVEFFESIDGISAAKQELIEGLPPDGIAILNADDERVKEFPHPGRTILYGFSDHADIRAEMAGENSFCVKGTRFSTRLPGRHSISNILAGIAVATAFEIPLARLIEPVSALQVTKMRGERVVRSGITILNDSYNSNPEAARRMIDCLRQEKAERRIAVLGEMLELGYMSELLHRDVGNYADESGIDVIIGIAGASRSLVNEAQRNREAYFFADAESAGVFLKDFVRAGDAILFKGSRGTHVERALARIEE